MNEYIVRQGSTAIQVIDNEKNDSATPPLVVLNGIWEPAARALPLLSALDSRALSLSFRGHGRSFTPSFGYDLAGHLNDIATVVAHCRLPNYCLLGFSRGAAYALGWTLNEQAAMSGLLLVDQPPIHRALNAADVGFWSDLVYQGLPVREYWHAAAIAGLARDAREVDFSSQLSSLRLPVALFVGANPLAAIPSNLTPPDIDRYRRAIPHCRIVEFSASGHMIPDDEPLAYQTAVAEFLQTLAVR